MAKTINITVRDKIATADDTLYVCGNSDFVALFDFDEGWEKHNAKVARFYANGKYTDKPFKGRSCAIPAIFNAHSVKIGVYAGNLSTTTPAVVRAQRSILCGGGTATSPETSLVGQLMEYNDLLTASEKTYVSIEKDAGNIVLRLHGDKEELRGCTVRAGYFVRRGRSRCIKKGEIGKPSRSHYWRFPANYDEDSADRWGYACLVGQSFSEIPDEIRYEEVPKWMPNGGYMQTAFPVDDAIASLKVIDIDPQLWLSPLLKPAGGDDWSLCGLIGTRNKQTDTVDIRFDLYGADGKLKGACRNVLRAGATVMNGDKGKLSQTWEYIPDIDAEGYRLDLTTLHIGVTK